MEELEVDYIGSEDASEMLVKVIRKYWNTRGFYPNVWIERVGSREKMGVTYHIRSDMRNGMPRHG